ELGWPSPTPSNLLRSPFPEPCTIKTLPPSDPFRCCLGCRRSRSPEVGPSVAARSKVAYAAASAAGGVGVGARRLLVVAAAEKAHGLLLAVLRYVAHLEAVVAP